MQLHVAQRMMNNLHGSLNEDNHNHQHGTLGDDFVLTTERY